MVLFVLIIIKKNIPWVKQRQVVCLMGTRCKGVRYICCGRGAGGLGIVWVVEALGRWTL